MPRPGICSCWGPPCLGLSPDPPGEEFGIVNEEEVDVFPEFLCFFYYPMDIGHLISGSSTFSKSSFYICKLSVHMLLKPSLRILNITLLTCRMNAVLP